MGMIYDIYVLISHFNCELHLLSALNLFIGVVPHFRIKSMKNTIVTCAPGPDVKVKASFQQIYKPSDHYKSPGWQ